jgi:ABC-type antimicrobial peptide transport system permease subunit
MFPGESALGKRARSWRDENLQREIVGVVSDVRYFELNDTPRSAMYVPHTQNSWSSMVITLRARAGDPSALAPLLRRSVAESDPLLAVASVGTMADAAMASVAAQRYAAVLLGLLAALAIGLAALGVYGVMTHVFAQRRREMGIRLALGASASSVYRIVFKYGFAMTGLGLVIGCAAAIAASRALEALLYETSPADMLSWVAMIAVMTTATIAACLIPARRAAQADPVSVLRAD